MIITKSVEEMLAEHGFCVAGIIGVSMLPMLRQGEDRVQLVRPVLPLEPGTVALYRLGQSYVLHRVIRYEAGSYLIRGDNCVTDEVVAEDQIIGMLSGFWRDGVYHDCTGAENAAFAARAKKTLPFRRLKAALAAWVNR